MFQTFSDGTPVKHKPRSIKHSPCRYIIISDQKVQDRKDLVHCVTIEGRCSKTTRKLPLCQNNCRPWNFCTDTWSAILFSTWLSELLSLSSPLLLTHLLDFFLKCRPYLKSCFACSPLLGMSHQQIISPEHVSLTGHFVAR